jgi:HEAT repeat protein
MLDRLLHALVNSTNAAADDVLLDALRLGSESEKTLALTTLIRRQTPHGLSGVIAQRDSLPQPLQLIILQVIKLFHPALRDCARGRNPAAAITAMKLIALGRQGRLTYLLSEGLHHTDDAVSHAAVEAMVALARWAATETHKLQRTDFPTPSAPQPQSDPANHLAAVYHQIIHERPEIEQAVARAMDVHRGKHGPELLRAALLLADWPSSKTLAILQTTKHGGQTAMVRRLQQVPDSEHIEAFLLAASHASLRSHFGIVFSHIAEPPVLDAILRKTHWLKDHQLQLCMHQVTRGPWLEQSDLEKDLARRDNPDAARVGEWIASTGAHDVIQDQRLDQIRTHLDAHFPGRLRLLRIALQRPRNASTHLLRAFLADPDQRLARMAARDFLRRKPPDYENTLIQLMTSAPDSVRRVIARSVGRVGFDHFWQRFDHLDKPTRKAAGLAMLKAIPDALQRLALRLRSGPLDQRIKAIQIVHDLAIADPLAPALIQLCHDSEPKIRSKAIAVLAETKTVPPDALLDNVLNDADPRVRANAIEVLEAQHRVEFVPLLTQRARSLHNRERANAIKALHSMKVATASTQLANMLKDDRPEHRISALWALHQVGFWQLLREVADLAKSDPQPRVRRYALAILRTVSRLFDQKAAG